MADLRWAAPSRADDEAWLDLLAAVEAVDGRGEAYDHLDVDDEWASVWAHPETDSVLVWDGADLVAFGWLKTQVGEAQAHRIGCWGGVRPSHRGRGIGRRLLAWQLRRSTEVAAGLGPAELVVDVLDDQHDLIDLVRRAGFEPVRRFLELVRPTTAPVPEVPAVGGLAVVPWCGDLEDATRAAHREAFADHWGSEPRGTDAWRQCYTGHRGFRPDLSLVALDEATGEVAAFVLCAAYPTDWEAGVPREAWINAVGTRRRWRGRGVACRLLGEVLRLVAASGTGFERAILGVDCENPTGALALYRGLGFTDLRATTTYRLLLPG